MLVHTQIEIRTLNAAHASALRPGFQERPRACSKQAQRVKRLSPVVGDASRMLMPSSNRGCHSNYIFEINRAILLGRSDEYGAAMLGVQLVLGGGGSRIRTY